MARVKVRLSVLRDIGWAKWNPIGLDRDEWCDDEYDGYLWQAAGMAAAGRTVEEIAAYLESVALDHIGMSSVDAEAAPAAATALAEYVTSLRDGPEADQGGDRPAAKPISKADMFAPLLQADPDFEPIWQAFWSVWAGEKTETPIYLVLGDLAQYLVDKLATGETSRFEAIFAVVEAWCRDGDAYVQEAAAVGLIEDLQNTNLHQTTKPADFLRWFGPATNWYWQEVDEFWATGKIIRNRP